MDVKDVAGKKRKLEKDVLGLIAKFNDETELSVDSVELGYIDAGNFDNPEKLSLVNVTVCVKF